MPVRPTSPLTPSPQPKRSLFSRIRSPFRNNSRSYLDFDIQPDDPHRQYSPGDVLTGTVFVKVGRPVRITHIVVSLVGYAQVFKTPNSPGEGYRAHTGLRAEAKKKREGVPVANGFVMLFEDEMVLCGEGRLDPRIYEFKFELLFPKRSLPSSIEFERGTVSYMISATLTRPTTMAAVTTCDHKIILVEDIDIAPLPVPKPRTASLEPVTRRTRARNAKKRALRIDGAAKVVDPNAEPTRDNDTTVDENDSPRSPTPSDVSFESRFSSTGTGSARDSVHISVGSGEGERTSSEKTASPSKRVFASVEIDQGGYLRGDSIPVKILVDHNKPIKNMHGVIVTFYRIARVDANAPMPPPRPKDGKSEQASLSRVKSSRGGLSIAPAGARHSYRKDLSQAFAPLFVDPVSLKAEAQTRVQVPAEAFPTIASVPGSMISFKYYVEVIVDLQGRLTGLDRVLANAGMIGLPTTYSSQETPGAAGQESSGSYFTAWGNNFIDTDPIRRDKSMATCVFEVVVGTHDSGRRRGKQRESGGNQGVLPIQIDQTINANDPIRLDTDPQPNGAGPGTASTQDPQNNYPHAPLQPPPGTSHAPSRPATAATSTQPPPPPPKDLPPPPIPSEPPPPLPADSHGLSGPVDEKQRLRQAEAALLPSAPPDMSGASAAHAPSAPRIDDDHAHLLAVDVPSHALFPFGAENASSTSGAGRHTAVGPTDEQAPSYDPGESGTSMAAGDDKQEMHRRRLEQERSAPTLPDDYDDSFLQPPSDGPGGNAAPSAPPAASAPDGWGESSMPDEDVGPSAPTEDEVLGFGFELGRAVSGDGETLPRYER